MTGILFIARLGSTRLPQKHLISNGKYSFIEVLTGRFYEEFKTEIYANKVKLIIATSNNEENKLFEKVVNKNVNVFYGSDENIPFRQLQCAQANSLEKIISIDGDDILASVKAARLIYNNLDNKLALKTTQLPIGLNVMGYQTKYLKECLGSFVESNKLETGWGRIFDERLDDINLTEVSASDLSLRFTLDYKEDSEFFLNIINHFNDLIFTTNDQEIINYVISSNAYLINIGLNNIFMENFNKSKQSEIDGKL